MACIILKGPDGERVIVENTPYRKTPDEEIIGINWDCGPQPQMMVPQRYRKCSNCGELGIYEST